MSAPDSCKQYFSNIKTATKASGKEAELQWEIISQSLMAIAARLRALSKPMRNRGSAPPDITNLEELEDILEKLYPALRALKRWVKLRNKRLKRWIDLLASLNEITSVKSHFSEVELKALLGDYMQNRGGGRLEKRSSLIKKRILIGIRLEELAEQIEDSLG